MLKVLISLLMVGGIGTGYIGFSGGDGTLGVTGMVVAAIFAIILIILFIKAIGCVFTIIAIALVLLAIAWVGGFVEMPSDVKVADVDKTNATKIDNTQKESGFWDNLAKRSMEEPEVQVEDKPQEKVNGIAKVVSGDTLKIGNKEIKMYGAESPRIEQTCTDKFNRSYYCGTVAAEKLAMMIGHRPVECTIIGNQSGKTYGICMTGTDDIGAYMVGLGYAFPNPEFGQVYIPYETNARTKKLGLWEGGQFYAPWQWDVSKTKEGEETKVKIVEPVKRKQNTGGTIWGKMFE